MAEAVDGTQSGATSGGTGELENVGYAPPDTGLAGSVESEIPVGVEALEASDIPTGDEVAAVEGDGLDASASADDAGGAAGTDAGGEADAEAEGDAEAVAGGDAAADVGAAADEAGDDATLKTDAEAQVTADT